MRSRRRWMLRRSDCTSVGLFAGVVSGVVAGLAAPSAFGADNHYLATGTGKWGLAANWSLGAPSLSDDNDYIDTATPVTVTIDSNTTSTAASTLSINNLYIVGTGNALNVGSTASPSVPLSMTNELATSSGGTLNIDGGTVNAAAADFGYSGSGSATQSGGALNVSGDFHLGRFEGASGSYALSGGSLSVSLSEYLGQGFSSINSSGTFTQSGGSNTAGNGLNIGAQSVGSGLYLMTGGALDVTAGLSVGDVGSFDQRGGTVTIHTTGGIGNLYLSGSYKLSNANATIPTLLQSASGELIGASGSAAGSFTQTGGTNQMAGGLFLAINAGQHASYSMSGGTLTAANLYVAGAETTAGGTATLTLSGGTATIGSGGTGTTRIYSGGTVNVNAGGALTTHSLFNDGLINNNGGSYTYSGTITGGGTISQGSGTSTVAANTIVDGNTVAISGGTATAAGTYAFGSASGSTATLAINGGSITIHGTLGAGNDGTLAGGSNSAHGDIQASAGTLYADTIILGNNHGGSADMTIGGTAAVTVGGGLSMNDLTVTGGSVTVQDRSATGDYPAAEDPVLHDAMVGGYLRSGALNINGGVVTTPKIKLGVTQSQTGTYAQTAGTTDVTTMGIGNDATQTAGAGIGRATLSGGSLTAATILIGSTAGGDGAMTWSGGTLNVSQLKLTGTAHFTNAPNLTPATPRTLKVNALSFAGNTATLDINNNDLIIDYAPGDSDPLPAIQSALAMGFNGGQSNGPGGIISGTVHASVPIGDGDIGLGFVRASDIYSSFPQTFGGMQIDSTSILVATTYGGDTNLNGTVDFNDLVSLAQHYGQLSGQTWFNGDFTYDGKVNFDDLVILAQDYGRSLTASQLAALETTAGTGFLTDWKLAEALAPEPASLTLILGVTTIALRRRRE